MVIIISKSIMLMRSIVVSLADIMYVVKYDGIVAKRREEPHLPDIGMRRSLTRGGVCKH